MGKKSSPEIPERYELEELLKYNTDLNRYDAVNPFGTQRWETGADGRWTMIQEPNEELMGMMHSQYDFVNRGPEYYETGSNLDSAQQQLTQNMMSKYGAQPGFNPDIPNSAPPAPSSYAVDRPPPPPEPEQEAPPAPTGIDWKNGGRALMQAGGQEGLVRLFDALNARQGS